MEIPNECCNFYIVAFYLCAYARNALLVASICARWQNTFSVSDCAYASIYVIVCAVRAQMMRVLNVEFPFYLPYLMQAISESASSSSTIPMINRTSSKANDLNLTQITILDGRLKFGSFGVNRQIFDKCRFEARDSNKNNNPVGIDLIC